MTRRLDDLGRGSALLAALMVSLVVVLVAFTVVERFQSRGPEDEPVETRSSEEPAAPPPSPEPSATDDPWSQAWRVDLGLSADAYVRVYVNGDRLVVYDSTPGDHGVSNRLRGYRLVDGQPREAWSTTPLLEPKALTSTALISSNSLIDPATGEVEGTPWGGSSSPVLVTDDLVIACTGRPDPACTGWDLQDGVLALRWGPVPFPGDALPQFRRSAIAGDTRTGYALATTKDSRATTSQESISFVSLADGRVESTRPAEDNGRRLELVPAADGWLDITDRQSVVIPLDLDGTQEEDQDYTATHYRRALLLAESGRPTLDQYKAALASGDLSWTSIAFDCHPQHGTCALGSGRRVTGADGRVTTWLRLGNEEAVTAGERYLVLRLSSLGPGPVRVIDLAQGRVVPLGESLYGERAHVTVMREDLLIALEDGALVAYAPTG